MLLTDYGLIQEKHSHQELCFSEGFIAPVWSDGLIHGFFNGIEYINNKRIEAGNQRHGDGMGLGHHDY